MRSWPRAIAIQVAILLATLAAIEVLLRVLDFAMLRVGRTEGTQVVFQHDPELGWAPAPKSSGQFVGSHTVRFAHNSLGLRDIEHDAGPTATPTILFLGDSFVWGFDVEAEDRFTERLRQDLPSYRVVNAGVTGYGTDQAYLLLRRLWDRFKPSVVVLMFCVDNDRGDNTTNIRHFGYYKPYLKQDADGQWRMHGQPVPQPHQVYILNNRLVHDLWIARLAAAVYVRMLNPKLAVPDPTERLIDMMKGFVEGHGARFLVGLQRREPALEAYLRERAIPFTTLEGVEAYPTHGNHWSPAGHTFVAARIKALLAENGVTP
jgi:hypothetical protein